jgi:hypothetical protein
VDKMGLCPTCRGDAESRIIEKAEKPKRICDRCGRIYYE